MHKNQKLGLTALIAFGAVFGTWYALQGPEEIKASGPISPAVQEQGARQTARERQMSLRFENEVPDEYKKVEKGLAARWGHLDEEVLTAASMDGGGQMVYFDKKIIVGRTGDGKPLYAQGAHRAFKFEGEIVRSSERDPITVSIKPKQTPGTSYLFQALRNAGRQDRDKMPQPKSPASDG